MPVIVGIPDAPVVVQQWREMTIIFRMQSGRVHAVDGGVYGTLAVHEALPADTNGVTKSIVVTHLPSKLAVVRVATVEDAIACAEHLWGKCRDAWTSEVVFEDRIPASVVDWIKRCNRERKMV